jgi:DNA-directed RNA polymerase subunit RPC12/RpoP
MNKEKINTYINQRKYEIHTGINAVVGSKFEIERRLMANRLDELLELEKFIKSEPEETCEYDLWDEDSDTYKCSQCGELWTLIADSPLENNMNYCPKCGRKIIAGE